MSLEQQIAALVDASNNLTGAVNGKITEIDKKVDDAVKDLQNAFPSEYQKYSLRTHYVDPVNGSDSNDGSDWGNAVKTLKKAFGLGVGALHQKIYSAVGKHVITDYAVTQASTVEIIGPNQSHYPNGYYSEATSAIIHFDKTANVASSLYVKLFGNLFMNNFVFTFEGNADSTDVKNCAFYGFGNLGLRLPLFVFDSANRGIMTPGNNFNPWSSLGSELPQFEGEAGFYVKGNGSTCIVNMDRAIDRTAGMQQKAGSVVVLS
ncbi:hypothetical protein CFE14_RS15860 [Vibrio parahaemolyticus]|nr:hypothetical protein [Vibrio parahaemolyticus]